MKLPLYIIVIALLSYPSAAWAETPNPCWCVQWIRATFDVDIHGDARTLIPNTPLKNIDHGDVLLLRYGRTSHAVYTLGFEGTRRFSSYTAPAFIIIADANFRRCKSGIRRIAIDDARIEGVLRPKERGSKREI